MFSFNNFFNSYWATQTSLFAVFFILAVLLSYRRKNDSGALPKETSNELRGLAILGVIFTHLTYGLFWGSDFLFPFGIWGGVAVNLFFFLSGYGLAASAIYHPKPIVEFYQKRVVKIFLPLWLVLIALLLGDALILQRFYPFSEIVQAFLGYFPIANLFTNINSPLWFITPLIGYYVIFPLVFRPRHPFLSLLPIFAFSALAFYPGLPVSYQISQYYQVHAWAFPLGALLAVLLVSPQTLCLSCPRLEKCFLFKHFLAGLAGNQSENPSKRLKPLARLVLCLKNLPPLVRWLLVAVLAYLAGYTAYYSGVGKGVFWESAYALFTMFCLLFLFMVKRGKFRLLEWVGVYSFEIYLWHWPLMSRYDIFYRFLPPWLATLLYLPLLLAVAWAFKRLTDRAEKISFKKIPS